jgi:hypothetical protein
MSGFVAPISELLGDESFEDNYCYWAAGALFILMAGNAPLGTWHLQRPLAAEAGIAGRQPQLAPKASPPPVSLGQNLFPARSGVSVRRDLIGCSDQSHRATLIVFFLSLGKGPLPCYVAFLERSSGPLWFTENGFSVNSFPLFTQMESGRSCFPRIMDV